MVNNMNEILNVIYRTTTVLIIVFIMFKLMGKKQVSQMNMFDYITGITIGSIVADISLDIEKNVLSGLTSLLIYFITSIFISYASLKSIKLRNFFDGKETPLIEKGKIIRKNMSKNKITINDLETEARLNGYFNLDDICNAILEPNGKISFEPKEEKKTTSRKDLNIKPPNKGLVYNLIIDGSIIKENLKLAKVDESWINHELKIIGKTKNNILLLTVDSEKKVKYYLK